ncbi:MAG TPA: C40 family peptidase [Candidatus Acidoferrum sp.]|nr:C40 family peptidase [Candidatus Acidoferrum sp.]
MKRSWLAPLSALLVAELLGGCAHLQTEGPKPDADAASPAGRAIQSVKEQYAPNSDFAIFRIGLQHRGHELVLTGDVDRAEAKVDVLRAVERTGARVTDCINVLPTQQLSNRLWGIACISVANGRELPDHRAELGTQVLMGEVVRVWKQSTNVNFPWFLVQAPDGYVAWIEGGTFTRCTREQVDAWNRGPLLIVTAFEERILEQPQAEAAPVSDVVLCDRLRKTGEAGDWYRVELPDGRAGYLPKRAAADLDAWKQARRPTAENIERTARSFMGRPYLWGGYSTKGFDCSGFVQQVFYINGIDLVHNAAAQARLGTAVPLDDDLSQLRKGDLLFFGRRSRRGRPERITHVGIYLGDKLFIQSSQRVRVSSLDPDSPVREEYRIRSLLSARRVLSP